MITTQKKRVSSQVSIQAPTLGLNAKDPLANMKETEAVEMDNYFPKPSSVKVRNGSLNHKTGFASVVETLAAYNSGTQKELFAFCNGEIFDATTAGGVGAAEVTGLTNSRFQTVNFGTVGGEFLLCVNGLDKMQVYTGAAWYADGTTTTISGFDTDDAIHINNFKNRVFLVERDSMSVWYLPVASIGGAANELNFSGIFRLGGYIMAMGNWTIDNAAGIDDYAVFITSEGEVALYKGTDPSSAADWALVGTFRMGRPIGRRCMCKAGADVLVLTTDGAFPLSKALLTDRSQTNLAATDKIQNLINSHARTYFNNFGWQPIIHPAGNKLIINVPQDEGVQSIQYVMNTTHGAWCRFKNWNASCFEISNDKLYFGTDGLVVEADVGSSDNGNDIVASVQQAYSYFGSKGLMKIFKMARPILISEGSAVPAIGINVDFRNDKILGSGSAAGTAGAEWDIADWDTSSWAFGDTVSAKWQSITGVGITGGLKLATSTSGFSVEWVSTDVIFETGSSL
ncbi:MAG: hypothetical protein ACRC5T_11190 [Cetobacterium sp.]